MEKLEKHSIDEFDVWAKTYDSPSNHFFFTWMNSPILKFLPLAKSFSLLDVGAGTGILLELILSKSKIAKLSGVDSSPMMVRNAKIKFRKNKNVSIKLGFAGKLPYKDNSFDFVVCANSFHHHPDSLKSLKDMKRVVKRGGKIILLDGCLDGKLRQLLFNRENKVHKEGKVYRYTKEQMKNLFQEAGLTNISQLFSMHINLITVGEKDMLL
jgi:ubiquinone/menaquinone biosynthesis C-methylase UbiE